MNEVLLQARQILQTLVERTEIAIEAAQSQRLERLQRILRRRAAALHNLRAVDAKCLDLGYNTREIIETKKLYDLALKLDRRLIEEISQFQQETKKQLTDTTKRRGMVSKYRSDRSQQGHRIETA